MTEIVKRFQSIRKLTEKICAPLKVEDHVPQPTEFVSPPKWHLAHTTWFFEEFILKKHLKGYKIFHEDFSYMFNSYYNTIGSRVLRTDRGNMTRPSLAEVLNYRAYVDEYMCELFGGQLEQDCLGLIEIGLNHEQQHQELLLTDLKFILGNNALFPVYLENASLVNTKNASMGWVNVPNGVYAVGAPNEGFHYDNEYGRHKVYLSNFSISKSLVTNGEYLEFIKDSGYSRHELWLDEGWAWVNQNQIQSPMYWYMIENRWMNYTLDGLKPIENEAQLCHVSHYEAAAFAEWKGLRLPTEFEWEIASELFEWGNRWEHTNSAYLAYPGFKRPKGAVGEYNGKFMMNQMVLRGASVATSPNHSSKTYRNFFHPNMQWQFSGIRLAKDE